MVIKNSNWRVPGSYNKINVTKKIGGKENDKDSIKN
jgi:hypothetical protein